MKKIIVLFFFFGLCLTTFTFAKENKPADNKKTSFANYLPRIKTYTMPITFWDSFVFQTDETPEPVGISNPQKEIFVSNEDFVSVFKNDLPFIKKSSRFKVFIVGQVKMFPNVYTLIFRIENGESTKAVLLANYSAKYEFLGMEYVYPSAVLDCSESKTYEEGGSLTETLTSSCSSSGVTEVLTGTLNSSFNLIDIQAYRPSDWDSETDI
ncbi:hypothetical protein AAIR98_000668 [Elusimicrobium simillimum]|uniref:hypothetical protein n=1 Tax=Elusimicrobium simillimum TaxID=3143438 RepID=UPI003C7022D2